MFARYPEVKNSSVELESSAGGFVPGQFGGHRSARAGDRQPRADARHGAGGRRHDAARRRHLPRDGRRCTCPGDARADRAVKTLAENVIALAKAPERRGLQRPGAVRGRGRAADLRRGAGQKPGADAASGLRGRPRRRIPAERAGRTHRRARAARILRRGGRSDADGVARTAAVRQLRGGPRRRACPSRCAWSRRAC